MLKLAELEDKNQILEFCSKHALGVRICCYMLSYGFEFPFVNYWYEKKDEQIVCVFAKFEDTITVCADDKANFSQLRQFVDMLGFSSLQAKKETADKLGFESYEVKPMLKFSGEKLSYKPSEKMYDYKKVYKLICSSIPNSFVDTRDAYNIWLSDFSFREKRKLARLASISEKEKLLCCALTASESETQALISGVACDKNQRGKGLGKEVVLSLVSQLQNDDKQVFVIALNDGVEKFYNKLGFKNYCDIAYVAV